MLCGIASGKDACQGDSGGPFTIQVILEDKGMKVVLNDHLSGARSTSPGWSCQLGLWMCSGEGCDELFVKIFFLSKNRCFLGKNYYCG